MAFVPQRSELPGEMSVRDVVLMGRYPLRRYRVFETAEDFGAADDAMRATSTLALADRRVGGLSVGEQQRVQVAAALAQAPSLMLLDEPTSALDPYHQLSIFELLSRLRREEGLSVVVVTHDLNQAGQFADALLLLHDGKVVASGAAESVLSETTLRSVYGVHFHRVETLDPRRAWVLPATLS
jgi:iron complex transport system ATP-binding protein